MANRSQVVSYSTNMSHGPHGPEYSKWEQDDQDFSAQRLSCCLFYHFSGMFELGRNILRHMNPWPSRGGGGLQKYKVRVSISRTIWHPYNWQSRKIKKEQLQWDTLLVALYLAFFPGWNSQQSLPAHPFHHPLCLPLADLLSWDRLV